MVDPHAWPQDWGTGLSEQVDWVDAAAVAHLLDHPNLRGTAEGMAFSYDSANNILNIAAGQVYLRDTGIETNDHREDDGPAPKVLEGGLFKIQTGVSGDLTLTDNEVNYVYVSLDQTVNEDDDSTGDPIGFFVNTTQTPPPEPYLRIGRVDTFADEVYEENRAPTVTTTRLHVSGYQGGS